METKEQPTPKTETQPRTDIKGWGIDADPQNDPTYPMRKRSRDDHQGYSWERPPQQPIDSEVLHSIERPNVTSVFGNSRPPRGLSGQIRRWAFQYGEGSFAHWLPLVLADRVDVVEGVIEDLKAGHVPNFFAERGLRASWKYDRSGVMKGLLIRAGVAAAVLVLLAPKRKR
ncbi:hypothetical protein SAMN05421823_101351 [Catalinimonas alkaloidigena]|uniref:Uncharacterized protein n=1 Tax=Catalinimonas alkaloidigena TaxID=1075417 RepID=A0A1G8XG78_9BACT|nr:hypothetical protein [Catalinimonas alkaloidigena]SDJ89284.1 hypothetical protein SAMN05421823_101351 [Catalinimonas alkaloidigena]